MTDEFKLYFATEVQRDIPSRVRTFTARPVDSPLLRETSVAVTPDDSPCASASYYFRAGLQGQGWRFDFADAAADAAERNLRAAESEDAKAREAMRRAALFREAAATLQAQAQEAGK